MTTLDDRDAHRVREAIGFALEPIPGKRSDLERQLVRVWAHDNAHPWSRGLCRVCGASFAPRCVAVAAPISAEEGEGSGFADIAREIGQQQADVCDSRQCQTVVAHHYGDQAELVRLDAATAAVTMTPWWDEHCPPMYREAYDALPPHVDAAAIAKARAYVAEGKHNSGRGLILLGASGAGKTTALWCMARDLERVGVRPMVFSAVELARELSRRARDIEAADFLWNCRALIIDDLGKEKLTAALAPLLWELLDRRHSHRRPTFVSTRFAEDAFLARFGDEVLARDIHGRLKEDCARILFTGKTRAAA